MKSGQKLMLGVCAAAAAALVGTVAINNAAHDAASRDATPNDDSSIKAAAEEGLCQKMATPCTDAARDGWHKMASTWEASIVRDGKIRAQVTYYSGVNVMDREDVARDESGQWRSQ